jgi:hypothetical protein
MRVYFLGRWLSSKYSYSTDICTSFETGRNSDRYAIDYPSLSFLEKLFCDYKIFYLSLVFCYNFFPDDASAGTMYFGRESKATSGNRNVRIS